MTSVTVVLSSWPVTVVLVVITDEVISVIGQVNVELEPVGTVPVDEPVGTVPVDEPVGTVPVDDPVETVPVEDPVGTVPVDEPVSQ